jgi:hypothetical protein
MKTRINRPLLAVGLFFAFFAPSLAQNSVEHSGGKKEKAHFFSIALESSDYEYKEPGVKYGGTMSGFSLQFLTPKSLFRTRFNYMWGDNLKHDDSTGNKNGGNNPFYHGKEEHQFYDLAFAFGFKSKLSENFSVAPYFGWGARNLTDEYYDLTELDSERTQRLRYLLLGADWTYVPAHSWKLAFNTEYDFWGANLPILRWWESGKTTVPRNGRRSTFSHDDGHGLRFALKVEKDFGRVSVFAEPFYRYWRIERSDVKHRTVYLPQNESRELGVKIGLAF